MSHHEKPQTLWELAPGLFPDGLKKEKLKPSKPKQVKDVMISQDTKSKNPLQLSLFVLQPSCTQEFQPPVKEMTSLDKLKLLHQVTQDVKSLQKLDRDSILGGASLTPFWNELSTAISNCLSLPTPTDLPDFDLTLSNGCVKDLAVKSWFSINRNTVVKQNSYKICCPSSTVFPLGYTDCVSTKKNSGGTRKYQSKKRHSQKLTAKPAPNSVRKIRVYPDSKLNRLWRHWLAGCRFVYNRCIETFKNGFQGSSYDLEALVLNDLPEWLKTVPRHPKANAVQDAYDAWKQAKANDGEAKFRSCRQSVATIKFKVGNFIKCTWFPQLTKGCTFEASQPLPLSSNYGTQLVRDRRRWFAVIPEHIPREPTTQNKVIALDPGVRSFLTGYDGEAVLEIGKGDIERIVRLCFHLDKLMSRAYQKQVKAKYRRCLLRAASRIRIKIRNLVDELHHQIASYLVRNYKVIFIPTFETSGMVLKSKRRINTKSVRSMLTWSHYRFQQSLISMADKNGVIVVEMNEAYTSKTCGKCGHIHAKLGGNKVFKCPKCGYVVDRDPNGAFNIMLKALAGTPFILTDDAIEIFSDVGIVPNV
jgi:putative transposase